MTDPKPPEHLPSSAATAEPVRQSPAGRLARFYETLTPAALPGLDQLYAPDARFRDPFNEVAGTAAIRRIFEHMFATTEAPRFEVTDCKELSHVALDEVEQRGRSRYLVAVPLKDATGMLQALLVVERMPFFALHEETLQMLNLLLGYYADSLNAARIAEPILRAVPACPPTFAFELMRVWHIRRAAGVRSALVALEFRSQPGFDDLALQIERLQRALDSVWACASTHGRVLFTLMPLAGESAAQGYANRVEGWIAQNRGATLEEAGVTTRVVLLDQLPPEQLLLTLLQQCHVPAETRTERPRA